MHRDSDIRQEQLNKSSLLATPSFLESLLDMWVEHIVSFRILIFEKKKKCFILINYIFPSFRNVGQEH